MAQPSPSQTYEMESFATIVKGFQPLTIVSKISILHVWGTLATSLKTFALFPSRVAKKGEKIGPRPLCCIETHWFNKV